MKSLFFKGITPAFLTFTLFATLNTQAMEQNEIFNHFLQDQLTQKEPSELIGSLSDEEVNLFLVKILKEQIDNYASFKKTPTTICEALVRLQCIAHLFDKTRLYIGDMEITEDGCVVNNLFLLHHIMINARFKECFDLVKKSNLLPTCEKSVEAMNIILESISEKVKPKNVDQIIRVINCLPPIFAHHIKNQIIGMRFQEVLRNINPYEIVYDDAGKITSLKFAKGGFDVQILNIRWIREEKFGSLEVSTSGFSNKMDTISLNELYRYLNCQLMNMGKTAIFAEKDFIWQLNFEEELEKKAQKNKTASSNCIIC